MTAPDKTEPLPRTVRNDPGVTQYLLRSAVDMARTVDASDILLYGDILGDITILGEIIENASDCNFVLVTRDANLAAKAKELVREVIEVPDIRLTRMGQIKIAVLMGLADGIFRRGDRIVCLSGIADSRYLDTMVFMEVGEEFEMFSSSGETEIRDSVNTEVFNILLSLAVSLANEGREGKMVGTCFVMGNMQDIRPFCRQMVLNPFHGYPEEQRTIYDAQTRETIKEFSAIDGAFLIRNDGMVEAAGVFLQPNVPGEALPRGLGARHHAAAAITATTPAIAITVSESTGTVTVYQGGKIFMEIEAARRIGTKSRKTEDFFQPLPLADKPTVS